MCLTTPLIDWKRSVSTTVTMWKKLKKLKDNDKRVEEMKLDKVTEDFVTKTKKKLADSEDHSRL